MSVTPDDIAVALGRDTPAPGSAEYAQWDMWIADARMLIEARLGDLDELDQAKLDYVVREAVVAHVQRPDDATQVAVSVDDGSVSRTYRSSVGRVRILDEWWDLLSPATASGAFSFRPSGSGWGRLPGQHYVWCGLAAGEAVCTCGVMPVGFYDPGVAP